MSDAGDFLQKSKHLLKKMACMTLQGSNHALRTYKFKTKQSSFPDHNLYMKMTFAWHSQGKTNKLWNLGAAKTVSNQKNVKSVIIYVNIVFSP